MFTKPSRGMIITTQAGKFIVLKARPIVICNCQTGEVLKISKVEWIELLNLPFKSSLEITEGGTNENLYSQKQQRNIA